MSWPIPRLCLLPEDESRFNYALRSAAFGGLLFALLSFPPVVPATGRDMHLVNTAAIPWEALND